jgi:hypothetical protein
MSFVSFLYAVCTVFHHEYQPRKETKEKKRGVTVIVFVIRYKKRISPRSKEKRRRPLLLTLILVSTIRT